MPSAPDRESIFESLSLPVFSILGAISLAIWWSPLASSFALALHDDQYTHILLILPISAALIFMDWKRPEPFQWIERDPWFSLADRSGLCDFLHEMESVGAFPQ